METLVQVREAVSYKRYWRHINACFAPTIYQNLVWRFIKVSVSVAKDFGRQRIILLLDKTGHCGE